MTEDEREELERLRRENTALKQQQERGLYLKVSQKGAVSLYGLGRFPVTLYKEQWEKVFAFSETIRTFLAEHATELKVKAPKDED